MKKQKQGTEAPVPGGDSAEIKPKARKKKTSAESEIVEAVASSVEPEAVTAKPAKKAAKKAKAVVETAEAPAQAALFEAPAAEEQPVKAAKPKKAAKPAKKDKGRDLVVDEPGAQEVAEVLHHAVEADAPESTQEDSEPVPEFKGLEPKLERLQKILAKAGISSRRKAEELILGGRVQINGKVVMELGTKADPSRDHVRVDGKLLQGPERVRYFVLNKPKGYVTTVSDPEGRPTVMQFFATERERLYPVGRLDYLSEGLLLVTNDGELANKLTKAASGVEKTYLVKVAGQPTEDMLDALREGVVIERGRPGTHSGRVRTAPAKIRQVRQGDNPWYEVIIIEGRNRELRKMFEEIGHHVEKIRRVGYGPLVLDLEPGKLRELEPEEVHALRLASEGKLKTRRRRGPAPAQLPTVAGKTVRYKKADGKPGFERPSGLRKEFKPEDRRTVRSEFQQESKRDFNPSFKAPFKKEFKPAAKPGGAGEFKPAFKPAFIAKDARPEFKSANRTEFRPSAGVGPKPGFKAGLKPGFKPGFKPEGRPAFGGKPRSNRPAEPQAIDYVLPPRKSGQPENEAEFEARPTQQKPGFNPDYKPGFRTGAKPAFRTDRPLKRFGTGGPASRGASKDSGRSVKPAGRGNFPPPMGRYNPSDDDFISTKTPGFKIEPVEDKPRAERPRSGGFDRAGGGGKPFRPTGGRPANNERPFRPRTDPPASGLAGSGRPFRPDSRPDARTRSDRPDRPARFAPRTDGPPSRGPRTFGTGEDRPREFRPRTGDGPPKKFAGAKPSRPAASGESRTGSAGEPRKKERWRNSFTGKNKGRPKPKPKA